MDLSPALVAALVLFIVFDAVTVLWIVRRKSYATAGAHLACGMCGQSFDAACKYCPHCGQPQSR